MVGSESDSVTDWFHSLENSDSGAVQNLWDRYFDKLVDLARGRLDRDSADGEAIASGVFSSLWRGAQAGRFKSVQNRDELWWLLLRLTRMKIADNVRERSAQKRGGDVLHVSLTQEAEAGISYEQLMSTDPRPDDLVALDDQFSQLLSDLQDDQLRQVAILRMEGYSYEEIATRLEISTATVTRKLRLIRGTWESELDP